MASRTYADRCGIARALDLVGERWALLVVRELLLGPKRFTDLRAGLPMIGPDVLSQRIRELESSGLIERREMPPPSRAHVYGLTPRGQQLEPVLLTLGRFGSIAPFPDGDATFSPDAAVVALKTTFRADAAAGVCLDLELRLGDWTYALRVADEVLQVGLGAGRNPDAVITADASTMAAVLWHGLPLDAALSSGSFEVTGDHTVVRQFLSLFPLPT
jgi:DNA-binding HxlR family transcriptional regulator